MKKILRKTGRILWIAAKITIVVILLAVIFLGIKLYNKYGPMVSKLRMDALRIAQGSVREDFTGGLTTVIYDANGEIITSLRSGKEAYYLEYSQIPKAVVDAMVVTEDRKFYSHNGVDYVACVRAALELVKNDNRITQGASTITQQLARGIYLSYDVTYERKITEIFLAWELEKKYSKQDIMEFYLNDIYFGNGLYGIQAASFGYFGKSVKELSLSEMVYLCAIPNNPSAYDPYRHPDDTAVRRDRMLKQMYDHKKIGYDEYQEAMNEEIVVQKSGVSRYNYAETYSKYCAVRALMAADGFKFRNTYTSDDDREAYEEAYDRAYSYWQQKMYGGGYRIYTSLDLGMQDLLQEAVNENLSGHTEMSSEGVLELQASATCIDNDTGLVVAIVGGREQEFAGYTLNRAYQSFRQPGSSIKPLIVYTPWFERGLSPDDILNDVYSENGPKNAGDTYSGEITVRFAVERSRNTVAWELFKELTPEVGLSYIKNMMFRKIVDEDNIPAASLGGLTYGVSSLEMASAYSALCNGGVFRTPTCIDRITDVDGNVIVSSAVREWRVYEENASRVMTDVMKGVLISGTGKKFKPETAITAAKTGTTNDTKDGWFVGFSVYYTTAVWVGYDYPREIEDINSTSHPGRIWKQFVDEIHEGLPAVDFPAFEPIPQTRFPAPKYEDAGQYKITPTPMPERDPEMENEGDTDPNEESGGTDQNEDGWTDDWHWD